MDCSASCSGKPAAGNRGHLYLRIIEGVPVRFTASLSVTTLLSGIQLPHSPSRYSFENDVRSVRAEPRVVGLDRHVTEEVAKLGADVSEVRYLSSP